MTIKGGKCILLGVLLSGDFLIYSLNLSLCSTLSMSGLHVQGKVHTYYPSPGSNTRSPTMVRSGVTEEAGDSPTVDNKRESLGIPIQVHRLLTYQVESSRRTEVGKSLESRRPLLRAFVYARTLPDHLSDNIH